MVSTPESLRSFKDLIGQCSKPRRLIRTRTSVAFLFVAAIVSSAMRIKALHFEIVSGLCARIPADNFEGPTRKPIWIPGYPGSGSEMLREVIEAVTGLEAGNVYASNFTGCSSSSKTITCKTHWPMWEDNTEWGNRVSPLSRNESFHQSSFFLLRNPSRAIPSFFNYEWERVKRIKDHSSQAPETEWKSWRDRRFNSEIQIWRNTILRWKDGPYRVVLYLPYEQLVGEKTGPALVQDMAQEFRKANFTVASDEDIECLWHRAVKEKPRMKRMATPSFTLNQQKTMIHVLDELIEKLSDEKKLVDVFSLYREDIEKNLRLDLSRNDTFGRDEDSR